MTLFLTFFKTYHIYKTTIFSCNEHPYNNKILISILLFLVNTLYKTCLPTFKMQKISIYTLILTCISIKSFNNKTKKCLNTREAKNKKLNNRKYKKYKLDSMF